jgi:para-nitrobenzyl esterase
MSKSAGGLASEAIARTRFGRLRGVRLNGVFAFKGVRYGAPPVGEQRFMPPGAPTAWNGTQDALNFGPMAIQLPAYPSPEDLPSSGSFWSYLIGPQPEEGEDCLWLNVWSPALRDGLGRPVMVWFHGGAFLRGAASWEVYDGENLARDQDVVVVTVNHRLNAFGFSDLSQFDPRYKGSGNAGMLDLLAALEWVRNHAEEFGGDPQNVTIFGESGGAGKVATLMAMPAAKGLFHKAIMQSNAGGGSTAEYAADTAMALLRELDIEPICVGRIAAVPAAALRQAALKVFFDAAKDGKVWPLNVWRPVVDGIVVPMDPDLALGDGAAGNIPLLIGSNEFELTTLAFYLGMANDEIGKHLDMSWAGMCERLRTFSGYDEENVNSLVELFRSDHEGEMPYDLMFRIGTDLQMRYPTINVVEKRIEHATAATYMYRLDWRMTGPGEIWRTPHGLDVPFVFANATRFPDLFEPSDKLRQLSNAMSSAWCSFARSGVPAAPHMPGWPAYNSRSRNTMIIDTPSRVVSDPAGAERQLISTLPKLTR